MFAQTFFMFMIYINNNVLKAKSELIEMMFVCVRKEKKKERENWRVAKIKNMVFPFL